MNHPSIWTPQEASAVLKVSRRALIDAARFGRLPAACWFRVGKLYRFRAEELMHMRSGGKAC